MKIKTEREHVISLTDNELRGLVTCVRFAKEGAVMTHALYPEAFQFSKEFLHFLQTAGVYE